MLFAGPHSRGRARPAPLGRVPMASRAWFWHRPLRGALLSRRGIRFCWPRHVLAAIWQRVRKSFGQTGRSLEGEGSASGDLPVTLPSPVSLPQARLLTGNLLALVRIRSASPPLSLSPRPATELRMPLPQVGAVAGMPIRETGSRDWLDANLVDVIRPPFALCPGGGQWLSTSVFVDVRSVMRGPPRS